jgi:YHS domain-containing protein
MRERPKRLPCDPVCRHELTEEPSLLSTQVKGDTYLFCSERCRGLHSIRPGWLLERTESRPARRPS